MVAFVVVPVALSHQLCATCQHLFSSAPPAFAVGGSGQSVLMTFLIPLLSGRRLLPGKSIRRKVGKMQWSEFLWWLCHRNFPVDWTYKTFASIQAQCILPFFSYICGFC